MILLGLACVCLTLLACLHGCLHPLLSLRNLLQVQPPRAWLSTALAVLREKLGDLGPQGLSNVMWALCKMSVVPDRAWLADYFRTSLQVS